MLKWLPILLYFTSFRNSIMCVANKELLQKSKQDSDASEEFFSVSTIAVNPDRIDEVSLSSSRHRDE